MKRYWLPLSFITAAIGVVFLKVTGRLAVLGTVSEVRTVTGFIFLIRRKRYVGRDLLRLTGRQRTAILRMAGLVSVS